MNNYFEKFESMTKSELSAHKQQIKSKIAKLNKKLSERKKYLKSVRNPNLTYGPDKEYEAMKAEMLELAEESSRLKEFNRTYNAKLEAERLESELALRKAQDDALKYDKYRERLADERRPKGERIWMGSEFRKLRPAEKRFIMLIAREIGQQRFQELRRIAFADEKHHRNVYYTGSNVFNNGEGAYEPKTKTEL